MFRKELKEVESQIARLSRKLTTEQHFVRHGLTVPEMRKLGKSAWSFSNESPTTRLKIWDFVWKQSQAYEAMSMSLYAHQYRKLTGQEFQTLKSWVQRCHCWEHSDDLSKIFASVVEENPEWILPKLRQWNRARNPWKRRQSIVSLLEYSCKRKQVQPFAVLIAFVESLLEDPEYYVQKGVGWTLREIYNVYPQETLTFLEENIVQIHPIAYSAATEKIPKVVKRKFNLTRKEYRKNK